MARAIARLGAADLDEEERRAGKRARGKGKRRAGSTKARGRPRWEEEEEEDVGSNGNDEEEDDDKGVEGDEGAEDETVNDSDDSDDAAQAIMQLAHAGEDSDEEEGEDDEGEDDAGDEDEEGDDGDDDLVEDDDDEEEEDEQPKKKAKKARMDEGELARQALRAKEEQLKYRSHEFRLQLEALLAAQRLDYAALGAAAAARVADLARALAKAAAPGTPAWRPSTQLALTGSLVHRTAVVPPAGAALVADVAVAVPPAWPARGGTVDAWAAGLADALRRLQPRTLAWATAVRTERYFGGILTVVLDLAPRADADSAPSLGALRLVPVVAESSSSKNSKNSKSKSKESDSKSDNSNSVDAFVDAALARCGALRDTVKLVKIWMRERGMLDARRADALGGYGATLLLAHLAATARAGAEMTTYQLFRHFLAHLAAVPPNTPLPPATALLAARTPSPLSPRSAAGGIVTGAPPAPALAAELAAAPAVLVSPDGRTNCAAHMSASALAELTFFARASLAQLDADATVQAGFPELFATPVRPELLYDVLVSVPLAAMGATAAETQDDDSDAAAATQAGARIAALLAEGLDDRCLLVRPVATAETAAARVAAVGLVLNPETAFRQVQKGAPADDAAQSRRFRALWGSRAEVRSFQDTSVVNCVVFATPPAQRHTVVPDMVRHLLEHNLGVPRASIQVTAAELDAALPSPPGPTAGDDEQDMAQLARDFDVLGKRLCAMELPLRIREVLPTSAALRYTAVSVPRPVVRGLSSSSNGNDDNNGKDKKEEEQEEEEEEQTYIPAVRGVIHFESSSAWPEDLDAFRSVKTALLVAVADVLRSKYLIDAFPYPDHIDVVFKGTVFSLTVHHPREAAILRRHGHQAEAAALARDLLYRPMHHALVRSMCGKHYAYSRTVRLAKRWLAAHMFSAHITEEAVELLVARCFAQASPLLPPQTPVAGFARFLALLRTLGTAEPGTPVIVDTDGDLTPAEYRRLQAHRPAPGTRAFSPLVILTPNVGGRSLWTALQQPGIVVLKRIAAVAASTLALLTRLVATGAAQPSTSTSSAWKVLFNPPLEPYSFTVHLRLERLTRLAENLDWHLPVWAHRLVRERADRTELRARSLARIGAPLTRAPVLEFDPATIFCRELQDFLGPNALVFHDEHGGSVVGVVWNPTAFTPRRWNSQQAATFSENLMPISDVASREARQFALNVQQILADVCVLGNGIVYELRKQGQAPAVQDGPCSDK